MFVARAFRSAAEILGIAIGIFDCLGEIRSGIGKIQIMGCTGFKTLFKDLYILSTVNQHQYRDPAFSGRRGKFCNGRQAVIFCPANIDHGNHRSGRKKPCAQIVQSAGRMHPPPERRNLRGQRIALLERKQKQISEFYRMRRQDG